MGGETDQYHPDLVHDNHNVEPPRTPEEGYHLTEDLADQALLYMKDLRATSPDKPFLLWFAPGACHAPHQAPESYIAQYRGQFDDGWDAWRDRVFATPGRQWPGADGNRAVASGRRGCRRGTRCRPTSTACTRG